MKSRKLFAFLIIHFTLTAILLAIVWVAPDALGSLGITVIVTIVGNGATYIGGNVASAWQKSKYYQEALDDGGANGNQRKG